MRPKYHLTAPFGLINDPNGFIKYKNEYYLFFQWNPDGLLHENKHWGLKKTKDFINFSDVEIALEPDAWFDKDGCYSGTSRTINDKLYLIYTGNVKSNHERQSYQCVAKLENDAFVKLGPILKEIPQGYTDHFRDPFYFERDNQSYFMIGAQNKDLEGEALIYNWDVFDQPQLLGPIKFDQKLDAYMWECPNLWQAQKDVLIFSPQGIPNEKYQYQNLYHSVAAVGKLNMQDLSFKTEHLSELDNGFDFYAPQVYEKENLLIGWMGLPEKEMMHPSQKDNWLHTLTMVRTLSLNEDNELIQKPHPFYKKLRMKKINGILKEKFFFNYGEIKLDFKINRNTEINLKLFASDNYQTTLTFKNDILTLDRSQSEGLTGIRYLKLKPKESLKLQIFMDKSTLEIFVNDGEKVMSSRIYNTDSDVFFELTSIENVKLQRFDFYEFER